MGRAMGVTGMDADRLQWILNKVDEGWARLSTWEENFLEDMRERLDKYGDNIRISEKQEDVLERISDKYE